MAWEDSSSCISPDLSKYYIPGKYWEEAESRESLFEEVGGGIPTGLETSRMSGRYSVKKKSEDVWPTFRVRDRDRTKEMQGDRNLSSSEVTFRSRKTYGGHPRAKEVPNFANCRRPDKGINLVGCKAGISGLLFFPPAKCNNTVQKRYGFGSWGCTSAPEVYLPASASKVVRASADWDAKRVGHRSSRVSRGGSGSRKSSQRRTQVAPQPNPMWQQVSRRQTTPIVDPDMWCSRGLAFTTDPSSLDCVVPTGNVHVCARHYRRTNSNSSKITPGTQLDTISRERYSVTRNGDESKIVLDTDGGLSVARSLQVQGSRRLSGGLAQQLLMLETTLLLGGLDMYDQHRDLRLDVDNMSYEDLLELGERIGYVNTGLSEETIIKCIKKKHCILESKSSRLTESDRKCSICQEEYEIADEIGKLHCGHAYHVGCIKKWLLQKNVCPVCKASALS
ncbi:hypothetical protein SUGI_0616660 [Cryptomeria japonica]|uniref:E3 ubiquitin-protein ligase MBR2 n=1 Tax=Cryptomeria japonica TaxID=3369 RepID=UPI002414979C|nr:E3 ubiquitin-protein ligase MBR2 [Cryptomeria japonica]XP_057833143.1 E3 ubiquitin-protein ligase MBR2 [Cryptomeria japonica]XP_057833151.1 E3 ubiquitin-protein ligase MBR2 [Cryptomeria japonica]XP_059063330.1 E3 ubiquitin-protein ligase MBR2 [Cryptomeria japonica]GLJ30941.1 hypothetical protein SUGI_0616660 [Cryptomeria japonica]